jgi:hypothetical protein
VFGGLTLASAPGVAALKTYTPSTLPTRAISAIHWPSGLTMNWSRLLASSGSVALAGYVTVPL